MREARVGMGYLHTGIEKNMEFRTWTQGVTWMVPCTCWSKAPLGSRARHPGARAAHGLNRIASHLVAIATGGANRRPAIMIEGFQAREYILKIFELIRGLRMNHAYIRPGGLAQDIPPGTVAAVRDSVPRSRSTSSTWKC